MDFEDVSEPEQPSRPNDLKEGPTIATATSRIERPTLKHQVTGQPPLWLCAKNGWDEQVRNQLRHHYCDTDEMDSERRTPLWWAARNNRKGVTKLLLAKRIDVNQPDEEGRTPLHVAALYGHKEIIKSLLIRRTLDVNRKDDNDKCRGETPLHLAARHGHSGVLDLLLAHGGIDVNSRDGAESTPLHAAAHNGFTEVVRILLAKDGILAYARRKDGRTPLHAAATTGCEEVVRELLATVPAVDTADIQDNAGDAPLHIAAFHGYTEVARMLLTKSASVNIQNETQRTPLHYAAREGHTEIVKLLLEQIGHSKASMSIQDRDLLTPICLAVRQKQKEVVKLFLARGGQDTKSKESYDQALLKYAVRTGDSGVVHLMLDKNRRPNVNFVDVDNRTLLWLATERNDKQVIGSLLNRDNVTLHLLVRSGELRLVRRLLRYGYDSNVRDAAGRSALHIAILCASLDITNELISSDTDIDGKDDDGNTPLCLAVSRKRHDFIGLLLESSASTIGIMANEWLEAFDRESSDLVRLSEGQRGEKHVRFFDERATLNELRNAPTTSNGNRRLFVLNNNSMCQQGQLPHMMKPVQPDTLQTFASSPSANGDAYFSVAVWFPAGRIDTNGNHFKVPDWGHLRVTWTTIPTQDASYGSGRRSTDHFSTLPNGWIPRDGLDLYAQFLRHLRGRWLKLCDLAEQHLIDCRLQQLHEKGENQELISRLAQNARTWTDLRRILADHTNMAGDFAIAYCARHDGKRERDEIKSVIHSLGREVGARLDQLDQIVRDLLQLEFAWVSINEAHRSTSLATSMKRLSWVTFIFLPAMFASSVFGMNVNLLQDNPDWRWFVLAGGTCLISTMCAWIVFKYCPIEPWLERTIGQRIQRATEFAQPVKAPKTNGAP